MPKVDLEVGGVYFTDGWWFPFKFPTDQNTKSPGHEIYFYRSVLRHLHKARNLIDLNINNEVVLFPLAVESSKSIGI